MAIPESGWFAEYTRVLAQQTGIDWVTVHMQQPIPSSFDLAATIPVPKAKKLSVYISRNNYDAACEVIMAESRRPVSILVFDLYSLPLGVEPGSVVFTKTDDAYEMISFANKFLIPVIWHHDKYIPPDVMPPLPVMGGVVVTGGPMDVTAYGRVKRDTPHVWKEVWDLVYDHTTGILI
jgi:hypothetical protein